MKIFTPSTFLLALNLGLLSLIGLNPLHAESVAEARVIKIEEVAEETPAETPARAKVAKTSEVKPVTELAPDASDQVQILVTSNSQLASQVTELAHTVKELQSELKSLREQIGSTKPKERVSAAFPPNESFYDRDTN